MTGHSGRVEDIFFPVYSPTTFAMTPFISQRPLLDSFCEVENSANEVAMCDRVSIWESSTLHSLSVFSLAEGAAASNVI